MTYEELVDFLEHKMSMSHVYQPLLVRALVDAGGVATVCQLANVFLVQDESQLLYYEKRIKEMPIKVLKKHDVVRISIGGGVAHYDKVSIIGESMGTRKPRIVQSLNNAPILVLQWLNADDDKEAEEVWKKFHKEVELRFAEVETRDEAIDAIKRWLHRNSNAQFLYFSTHGDENGLGLTDVNGIEWPELWDVLSKHVKRKNEPIALWLGACCSAYAAHAWSPGKGYAPVKYIVGFPIPIGPEEIGKVMKRLIKMTRLDPVTYVDEEMRKLRRSVQGTSVLMHYKAETKAGQTRYVNFDTFRSKVGMTLKQYLESKQSGSGRRRNGKPRLRRAPKR